MFALVVSLFTLGFRAIYDGRIFPGIYSGWINLSGQTPTDAAELLKNEYTYPGQGKITLQYDDLSWEASPAELGLFFSPNYNAELAFQTGREGSITKRVAAQIQVLRHGIIIAPQFVMDEKTGTEYLEGIADGVNQPVIEASLELEGLEILVQAGQIGREMDIPASLDVVALQVRTLQDGSIPLIVYETYPDILDVSAQAETAREILSQPLVLKIPDAAENDPGPWELSPQQLVEMMIIERISTNDGDSYRIALDPELLREYLESAEVKRPLETQPGITLHTDLSPDLFTINCSAIHIRKCVLNLFINACEAIDKVGTVTISTRNRYIDKSLKGYEEVQRGEYVVLSVADTGSGISSADREHIFEPFYSKKVIGRSGTGLGLAVVWSAVQDHNSYINVSSDDQGTCFDLYFPASCELVDDGKDQITSQDLQGKGQSVSYSRPPRVNRPISYFSGKRKSSIRSTG